LLRAALAGAEAAETGTTDGALVAALNNLGLLSKDLGRYDEAREHYLRAQAILERRGGAHPDDIATLYHNLGGIEHARGDYAAAEVLARRGLVLRASLGRADDCLLAADQVALAAILDGLARHDEAERLYLEAVATFERSPDDHDLDTAVALSDLGAQDAERGRLQHATERITRALELKRCALGRRHPDTAVTLNNLAVVARRAGALEQAAALSAEAFGILEDTLPADHPRLAICRRNAQAFAAANGEGPRDRA
jgi:tetratricopeptide (TPR) repeat protein